MMTRSLTALTASLALLAAAFLLGPRFSGEQPAVGDAFRYDIDAYRATDPLLLDWRESEAVPLGTGELGGLAVDGRGRIHVAAGRRLLVFDGGGEKVEERALSAAPGAVAVGPEGEIYLAVGDHIEVHSPGGAVEAWASLGEKAIITSLAASDSDVFAADAGSRLVWRFDRAGRLRGSFGRKNLTAGKVGFIVPSPYFDVALGADGEIWVVNPGRLRVELHSYEGLFKESWGEASLAVGGFGGCCNPTHIALLPDGSFVTSEKGLPRVKIYGPDGTLRSVAAGPESFKAGAVGLDLAVDGAGRILVLDPSRRALRIFERRRGEGGRDREES
jgi:hypothetical protein